MSEKFNRIMNGDNTELSRFRQEALQLLNQQSTKMRSLNAQIQVQRQQLQIKEEQFLFYKETISQLQRQNQYLLIQKNSLQLKLKNIATQISEYNSNVVQKIHNQNKRLKEQLQAANEQIDNLNTEIQSRQQKCQQQSQLIQSLKEQSKSYQQKIQLLLKELNGLQVTNQKYKLLHQSKQQEIKTKQKKMVQKDQAFQKLQFQYMTLNKQMANLMQKHSQTIKQHQKKMKDSFSNTVDKKVISQFQKIISKNQLNMNQFKQHLSVACVQRQQVKKTNLSLREQNLKLKLELQTKLKQLVLDLQNFQKSTKLGKKIVQFESANSEDFYKISEKLSTLHSENQSLKEEVLKLTQDNTALAHKLYIARDELKGKQSQCHLLKNKYEQEIEGLQSEYEGKLLVLSIKIRSQEESLRHLSKKEEQSFRENQDSLRKLQKLQNQFDQYKTSSVNTVNQLQKQNYSVMTQIQQLVALCQQNLDAKSNLDKIKYVFNSLLMTIWYIHTLLINKKQANKNICQPFINYYYRIHPKISQKSVRNQKEPNQGQANVKSKFNLKNKSQKSIHFELEEQPRSNRFRVCAIAILAVIKIKNSSKKRSSKGIFRHTQIAIKNRQKIQNIQQLLDNLIKHSIKSQDDYQNVKNVLTLTEKVYNWKTLSQFKKIKLNTQKDLQILQSQKTSKQFNQE